MFFLRPAVWLPACRLLQSFWKEDHGDTHNSSQQKAIMRRFIRNACSLGKAHLPIGISYDLSGDVERYRIRCSLEVSESLIRLFGESHFKPKTANLRNSYIELTLPTRDVLYEDVMLPRRGANAQVTASPPENFSFIFCSHRNSSTRTISLPFRLSACYPRCQFPIFLIIMQ